MGLRLQAFLMLDAVQFTEGLTRAKEKTLETMKGMIIAAAGVYGLEEAFRKTIDTADELVNTSQRLSIPIEKLQILREAAKDANASIEGIPSALEKLGQYRGYALGAGLSGTKTEKEEYLRMFSMLGVSEKQLKTMDAGELLLGPIAEKLKKTNPQEIIGPLRALLGRAGGELIPVLQSNFEEVAAEMKKSGALMSAETAAQLETFKKKINLFEEILISHLAPIIVKLGRVVLMVIDQIAQATGFWGKVFKDVKNADPSKTSENLKSDSKHINFWKYLVHEINRNDKDSPLAEMNKHESVLAAYDKASDELLNSLNKKDKPNFSWMENLPSTVVGKKVQTDSLVKVGNFLGSNKAAINAAHTQIQIANNTKRAADALDKIVVKLPEAYTKRSSLGLNSNIEWPVN